jgi:hypothetical protein
MGYMYSADPELARECQDNIDRFSDVFGDAIDRDIHSLYGIHDKPPAWMDCGSAPAVYRQAVDDAAGYMPFLRSARYRGYTVGTRAAFCDPATGAYSSKALVFRDFDGMTDYHVVLGGKVSCMFDVLAEIRRIVG